MKKANQTPGTSTYAERDLQQMLGYLDNKARRRSDFAAQIERDSQRARELERSITMTTSDLEALKLNLKKLEGEYAEMPQEGMTVEDGKKLLERIAGLAWVEKVILEGNMLHVFTRQGALKTDFYNRMVIGGGNRVNELLVETETLPLPQYEIQLDLRNMGRSWAVNPALSIRLSNPMEYNSFQGDEAGWVHEPRAHWACNNTSGSWGTLCLGDYDSVLINAAKKGLFELLTELAIFLQRSGWSSAYINKVAWSVLLGNPTYNTVLIRGFRPGEDVDSIVAENRKRKQKFLKDNNLTNNMYEYGSDLTDDDDDDSCEDCWCGNTNGYEDDCECWCHE